MCIPTKRGLSLDPRDRCEVQTYWVGEGFCPGVPSLTPTVTPTVINVDYLVIGAGAGGLATAMDLGDSLKSIGMMNDDSILLIEASNRIGGRHETIETQPPDGYEDQSSSLH